MNTPDLIVIGAGMAGINAAARAVAADASVVVIERDRVGGTCPVRGCIPSKALIRSAEIAHEARHAADYGIAVGEVSVDMAAVTDRVQAIVDKGSNGARGYLESLDGVRLVMGEARFSEPGVVTVADEQFRSDRVVIATGAEPILLPIPGLAETPHLTSSDVLTLRTLPERLLVIGAGPIGLELGQALSRLGSRVTIVEVAPRLLASAEPEMGAALEELLSSEGIELLLDSTIEHVAGSSDGGVSMNVSHAGATRTLTGDAILLGAGRGPAYEALSLPDAGIGTTRTGIAVNDHLQTSQAGHFAAGDILGPPYGQFTHTARQLGIDAAENALGLDPHAANPDVGPRAIFTDPEFVTVGMTEAEARKAGGDVGVGTGGFTGGKGRAWGQEQGLIKVVADRATRRILGASILGYHAADLIHPVVVAMRAGSADPLTEAYHVHPTLGESVQGAVRAALASTD